MYQGIIILQLMLRRIIRIVISISRLPPSWPSLRVVGLMQTHRKIKESEDLRGFFLSKNPLRSTISKNPCMVFKQKSSIPSNPRFLFLNLPKMMKQDSNYLSHTQSHNSPYLARTLINNLKKSSKNYQ